MLQQLPLAISVSRSIQHNNYYAHIKASKATNLLSILPLHSTTARWHVWFHIGDSNICADKYGPKHVTDFKQTQKKKKRKKKRKNGFLSQTYVPLKEVSL